MKSDEVRSTKMKSRNAMPHQPRPHLFHEYLSRGYTRRRALHLAGYRPKSKQAAASMAYELVKTRKQAQDSLTHAGVPTGHSEGLETAPSAAYEETGTKHPIQTLDSK